MRSILLSAVTMVFSPAPNSSDAPLHGRDLLVDIGMRNVDDVQEQIGFVDLFQRAQERGNEIGRQLLDKADRVRDESAWLPLGNSTAAGRSDPAFAKS